MHELYRLQQDTRPLFNPQFSVIRPTRFVLLVSLLNVVFFNFPLVVYVWAHTDFSTGFGWQILATVSALVFTMSCVFLSVAALLGRGILKLVTALFMVGNIFALYFMQTYNVLLDKSMMGNVVNTQPAEVMGLFSMGTWLMGISAVVAVLLFVPRLKLAQVNRWQHAALAVVSPILCGILVYFSSATWLWFDEHAKQLGGKVLPWSYVINTTRYVAERNHAHRKFQALPAARFIHSNNTNLHQASVSTKADALTHDRENTYLSNSTEQPTTVVLVLGESARADQFSLYGYERDTNPLLAQEDVIVLPNTQSCTTYTTASLQCIFSHKEARLAQMQAYETLPSYLQRFGVDVVWRTNNWGEPKMQVRSYKRSKELRENCDVDCRYDGVLMSQFEEDMQTGAKLNSLIVLHQSGSHGPAYSEKYPPRFQRFSPVCDSVDLSQCSPSSLVNAYDNTVVYTDYFLANIIQKLKRYPERKILMLYISDHGESLGESGFYLHGTPNTLAPEEQRRIPFLMWLSPALKAEKSAERMRYQVVQQHSQFEIFHTVMGTFNMRSSIYDARLDMLAAQSEESEAAQVAQE